MKKRLVEVGHDDVTALGGETQKEGGEGGFYPPPPSRKNKMILIRVGCEPDQALVG